MNFRRFFNLIFFLEISRLACINDVSNCFICCINNDVFILLFFLIVLRLEYKNEKKINNYKLFIMSNGDEIARLRKEKAFCGI